MRILALFPHKLWTARLSASRRHDLNALARRPDVEFHMSGQGWPDWDIENTSLRNVRRVMRNADCVVTYKLAGNPRRGIPSAREPASIAKDYLVAQKWQECWWPDDGSAGTPPAWKQAVDERVGLAILSHPNDRPRFARAEERGVRVAVIPHCAERTVFATVATPWTERNIDVLLTGAIALPHYPLRERLKRLIQEGRLCGCVYPHPGCWARNIKEAERRVGEYAATLGRTKLSLVTSSKYRYPLAKYVESAMAGCLVVGDMPDEAPEGYGDIVQPLDPRAADEELVARVEALLASGGAPELAGNGQQVALASYTQEHWADRFVHEVQKCVSST